MGAGGDARVGYSSASDPQVGCAVLRCLDCDFIVEQFENACWPAPPAVEYLFFRNQMPDRDALSQRLKRSPGITLYSLLFTLSTSLHLIIFSFAKFMYENLLVCTYSIRVRCTSLLLPVQVGVRALWQPPSRHRRGPFGLR